MATLRSERDRGGKERGRTDATDTFARRSSSEGREGPEGGRGLPGGEQKGQLRLLRGDGDVPRPLGGAQQEDDGAGSGLRAIPGGRQEEAEGGDRLAKFTSPVEHLHPFISKEWPPEPGKENAVRVFYRGRWRLGTLMNAHSYANGCQVVLMGERATVKNDKKGTLIMRSVDWTEVREA